ncbi:unnamed protein product, partial [Phaeothamnion confervicola]
FLVYARTVAPGIAGGDSGELVAESCHLGTAHPPGYPLFTLLTHAAVRLPVALGLVNDSTSKNPWPFEESYSPAWRANILTAACDAAAATLIAWCGFILSSRRYGRGGAPRHGAMHLSLISASAAAGALWAFSPLVWQYAVTAEVFALNNFFTALILLLALRFAEHRSWRRGGFAAFACGLALTNQHTVVLTVAPIAAWVAWQLLTRSCAEAVEAKEAAKAMPTATTAATPVLPLARLTGGTALIVLAFLAGLTPYAYLPLAARIAPCPGSWGDVASSAGLLRHFLRADYGSLRLYAGNDADRESFRERLALYMRDLGERQGLWFAVPALALWAVLYLAVSWWEQRRRCRCRSSWQGGIGAASGRNRRRNRGSGGGVTAGDSQAKVVNCDDNGRNSSGAKSRAPTSGTFAAPRGAAAVAATAATTAGATDRTSSAAAGAPSAAAAATAPCRRTSLLCERMAALDDGGGSACWLPIAAFMTYVLTFHTLSNMPLRDPLLFGVHARFWQQPNVFVFALAGVGIFSMSRLFEAAAGRAVSAVATEWMAAAAACVVSAALVAAQLWRWYGVADQSGAGYFSAYARAALEPLPPRSVLLINNDQVWTSTRYAQARVRSDVTLLNMSMMTFAWFKTKRRLYPHLMFPGLYYGNPQTPPTLSSAAAPAHFTMLEFIDANF